MKTYAVLIAVAGLALAGCSSSAPGIWRATEPADAYLEIADDGTLSGTDGCNRLLVAGKKTALPSLSAPSV